MLPERLGAQFDYLFTKNLKRFCLSTATKARVPGAVLRMRCYTADDRHYFRLRSLWAWLKKIGFTRDDIFNYSKLMIEKFGGSASVLYGKDGMPISCFSIRAFPWTDREAVVEERMEIEKHRKLWGDTKKRRNYINKIEKIAQKELFEAMAKKLRYCQRRKKVKSPVTESPLPTSPQQR